MDLKDNLRKKMLGLLPFDENSTEKYTPKEFYEIEGIPKKYIPVFHLKPWSQEQKDKALLIAQQLLQEVGDNEKIQLNLDLNDLARESIIKIENLFDLGKNEHVKIEKDGDYISKKTFGRIPKHTQTSIYFCVSSISGLTVGETVGL